MRRYGLHDDQWDRIKDNLPGSEGYVGGTAKTAAQPLLETADPRALIGDKAYDADALIEMLDSRAITPVIPPRENRKEKRDCDFALYRERNLAERFWNKIKHYRAIATAL